MEIIYLTRMQIEVVQRLAEGDQVKDIALRLERSEHTIKGHMTTLRKMVGARNTTQLVALFYRMGILVPDRTRIRHKFHVETDPIT